MSADKSLAMSMTEASNTNTVLHMTSQQLKHVDENFVPSFNRSLKQISSSQVLQLLAHERSWLAASELTKSVVIGLERKELLIATEEVRLTIRKSAGALKNLCIPGWLAGDPILNN